MYLSKIVINLKDKVARNDLKNIYELHRSIMAAFPDGDDGGPGRILFRIEEGYKYGPGIIVLVQSSVRPEWDRFERSSGYFLTTPKYKEFKPIFSKNQKFNFRLMANPTVKRDGKRLGLLKDYEQIKWIEKKATKNGFSLLQVVNIPKKEIEGKKPHGKDKLKFNSVLYEGLLKVDDPTLFSGCLEKGLGSGKGFGFGLLSISKSGR